MLTLACHRRWWWGLRKWKIVELRIRNKIDRQMRSHDRKRMV